MIYVHNDPINFRDPSGLFAQGNPLANLSLNAYAGGYSGGRVAAAPKDIFFNPVSYGPVNSISTASLIKSLSSPKNIDYNTYGLLQVPASRPTVDVNAIYSSLYQGNSSFRNRMDDEYALSRA